MILIKRLDTKLKKPKEKLIAQFSTTAEIDEETDTVILEKIPLAREEWDEETTNAIKRLLGLPITKELTYYKKGSKGKWLQYSVANWRVLQDHGGWCTLRIDIKELGKVDIHHAFLSEMQKPDFEAEYEKSLNNTQD